TEYEQVSIDIDVVEGRIGPVLYQRIEDLHDPDLVAGRDTPDITGALGPGFQAKQESVDIGAPHDARRNVGDAALGDPQLRVLIIAGRGQQLAHGFKGQAVRSVQIDLHSTVLENPSKAKCRIALPSCLSRSAK